MAAQSQIVAARSSSAAKREHETWTNNVAQLSPNGSVIYVFLCRVLVDHATTQKSGISTVVNNAHVYAEYL
eukprot:CAMPEP_0171693940 /NCGR_PEP_ID=MMETSP0991-20121206/6942_1 /TAXON_ID=483369 /ORGANISM="non described non described, Strain CCMP2098" /LENGTH=70 /DNA_ID=CAMNT_0012282473 /DNA_START=277 /DNA_END=486 /DNA_ORIENTATION=-